MRIQNRVTANLFVVFTMATLSACDGGDAISDDYPESTVAENAIVANLDDGTEYQWQVRSVDQVSAGPWSEAVSFTTSSDATNRQQTKNESHDLAFDVPELRWTPVVGAMGYEVLVTKASSGAIAVLQQLPHSYACATAVCQAKVVPYANRVEPNDQNSLPVAKISLVQESATTTPLKVSLHAKDSQDDDGSIVSYNWGVKGRFIEQQDTTEFSYTFDRPGSYVITLTVIDDAGAVDRTSKRMDFATANALGNNSNGRESNASPGHVNSAVGVAAALGEVSNQSSSAAEPEPAMTTAEAEQARQEGVPSSVLQTVQPAPLPALVVASAAVDRPAAALKPEPAARPEPVVAEAKPNLNTESEVIAAPEVIAEPVIIAEPEVIAEPVVIVEPEVIAEPVVIVEPEIIAEPVVIVEPEVIAEPELIDEPAEQTPSYNNDPFSVNGFRIQDLYGKNESNEIKRLMETEANKNLSNHSCK